MNELRTGRKRTRLLVFPFDAKGQFQAQWWAFGLHQEGVTVARQRRTLTGLSPSLSDATTASPAELLFFSLQELQEKSFMSLRYHIQ